MIFLGFCAPITQLRMCANVVLLFYFCVVCKYKHLITSTHLDRVNKA